MTRPARDHPARGSAGRRTRGRRRTHPLRRPAPDLPRRPRTRGHSPVPQRGRFTGEAVETWLWGLLPESEPARSALRRTHGADPRDPLSLLAAIGKDCAGAVQFCEPDDVAATLAREGRLEPVTDSDIETRLAAMRLGDDPSWVLPEEHWSLGGM